MNAMTLGRGRFGRGSRSWYSRAAYGSLPAALLLAALFPALAAAAVEPVGRVISVSGDATALRAGESARSLDRGDSIYEGDEIRTGDRGNVQVRFIDDGLVDLDPGTRFAIDRYRADRDDSGGSVLMNFIRGALRTITGSIDGAGDTYRMRTPTATIGIRGTGYALQYCDAACADRFGGEPGLHGRVDDGGISVATPQGSGDFDAGAFFFVPQDGLPQPVLQPPQGILDQIHEAASEGEGAGEVAEVVIGEVDETDPDALRVDGGRIGERVFEAGSLFGNDLLGGGVAAAGRTSQAVDTYSNAQLFGFGGLGSSDDGAVIGASFNAGLTGSGPTVALESGDLNEIGFDSDLGVGWGRWDGSFSVDGVSGYAGNLAFTVTGNFTAPTRLAELSGTLNYALAGGPKAFTPTSGTTWKVDAIRFGVDFGASRVLLDKFEITKSNDMAQAVFNAMNLQGSTLDVANNALGFQMDNGTDSGSVAGSFVGTNGEGMVVVYHVKTLDEDSTRTTVTGTSVLKQQ